MKKKNLIVIALASTALAIGGGVALASSMSAKAVEVKADSIEVYLRGSMNGWGTPAEYKFVTTADSEYDYELTDVELSAEDEWKIADAGWGSNNYGYDNMAFVGNNSYFSGKDNNGTSGNVVTKKDGTYDFFIKVTNSGLNVKVVKEPTAITQWDIIGSFNNWAEDETQISMTLSEGYYTATVDFATDVQFKIRGNNDWDCSLGSEWVSKINDPSILTTVGLGNAKVVYAGRFTFRISQDVTDQTITGGSIANYIQITYAPKNFADTLYVTRPDAWGTTLYAYAWTGESKNADWPGVPMTLVCKNELDQDVYAISGVSGFRNIIINDGTQQTVDGSAVAFGANDACWIKYENEQYTFGYYTFDTDKAALIDWAEGFIGAEDLCNGTGDEWSKFATSYGALDPKAKAFFATTAKVTANQSGNVLEKAAYRYERGVAAKNQTAFAESQRPKTGFQANYAAVMNLSHDNKNNITAIAVTAAVGAAAAAGFVFLRKRKAI